MKLVSGFKDYKIIDLNNGEKLELWGKYKLLRPEPQVVWNKNIDSKLYNEIDAKYIRNSKGGGHWEYNDNLPEDFVINYKNLKFKIGLMGFKHTGLFPEQSINWDYFIEKISNCNKEIKVLNLFSYTGGATVACMSAGAHVTHVDSSKGMVDWAKDNIELSNLDTSKVRFIVEDVLKFVKREIRRGKKYDAIIMDPPSFGRGSSGEIWDINKHLFELLKLCNNLLEDDYLFLHVNSYTTGLGVSTINNLLNLTIDKKGIIKSDEIGIPVENSNLILPCGIFCRIETEN